MNNPMDARAAHVQSIQHQIVISRQAMNDALDRNDMRKAEQFLDQLCSYKRLLEAAQ